MSAGLRAGQVAAAAGVNLQTLRYYERRGLLEEPDRTLGGHRVYSDEAVTLLRVIKTAQRLGFTLAEVAELLETGSRHHGRRPDAGLQARAAAKLAEVEQKITDLTISVPAPARILDQPKSFFDQPKCLTSPNALRSDDQPNGWFGPALYERWGE